MEQALVSLRTKKEEIKFLVEQAPVKCSYEKGRNQAFGGMDARKCPYKKRRNQAFSGMDISKPYTKKSANKKSSKK